VEDADKFFRFSTYHHIKKGKPVRLPFLMGAAPLYRTTLLLIRGQSPETFFGGGFLQMLMKESRDPFMRMDERQN
jgi:hypothetical protein